MKLFYLQYDSESSTFPSCNDENDLQNLKNSIFRSRQSASSRISLKRTFFVEELVYTITHSKAMTYDIEAVAIRDTRSSEFLRTSRGSWRWQFWYVAFGRRWRFRVYWRRWRSDLWHVKYFGEGSYAKTYFDLIPVFLVKTLTRLQARKYVHSLESRRAERWYYRHKFFRRIIFLLILCFFCAWDIIEDSWLDHRERESSHKYIDQEFRQWSAYDRRLMTWKLLDQVEKYVGNHVSVTGIVDSSTTRR